MNKEIWKDIEGYEGLYQVSNLGNVKKVKYMDSLASEILKDYKKNNKRLFIIIIIILIMWFLTIGYLVYILNDIGSYEELITQENEDGINNYIGNDGDIYNGEASN